MSLCPVCGGTMCAHTPKDRGQTPEEVLRYLTEEELELYRTLPVGDPGLIEIAQKNRHLKL